jgi:uncharacterized Zn finger protein
MKSRLVDVLTRPILRSLAGSTFFKRGQNYFDDDHVSALAEREGTVTARVQGTIPYRVKLWVEYPHLTNYQKLKQHADRINQWPAWREKSLALLRENLADPGSRRGWGRFADHSELVRIFLWEGEDEAAWQEATEGGCSNELWLELAATREKRYPADALPVYQNLIEPNLQRGTYEEAVKLLRKIRNLMTRLGREQQFAGYLESVRKANRRKRNFMKLLDRLE